MQLVMGFLLSCFAHEALLDIASGFQLFDSSLRDHIAWFTDYIG
jgi:hypothetical protein